jgi:hypothetical protein
MLFFKRVHRLSRLVVLFAATLVAANAQCALTCSFEQCGSAETPPSHCHHHNMPDKEKRPSPPCLHEIALVYPGAKAFFIAPVKLLLPEFTVLPVTTTLEPAFDCRVDNDVSPPVPPRSSISVLRI